MMLKAIGRMGKMKKNEFKKDENIMIKK